MEFIIDLSPLHLKHLAALHAETKILKLSEEAKNSVISCRKFLDQKLAHGDELFYGINTGFGALCDVKISPDKVEELQVNLIRSHSAGMGDEVPEEIVRLMLLLKIKSLIKGHSGVSLSLVERLIEFYNQQIHPVIYEMGSLGASGDLAPLAHLGLPLIGEGEVNWKGEKRKTKEVLKSAGLAPLKLRSKEGLALLNGTQFSTAYGVWALLKGRHLLDLADLCASLSYVGFNCRLAPINRKIHSIRNQPGQKKVAKNLRACLENSGLADREKHSVQDPYAFRCVPQVHGASRDAFAHIREVIIREVNAVTDNPNLFPDSDEILSGGNFHAQPVALTLDYMAMAMSELGSISERRLYKLLSGKRGLSPFLAEKPGFHSGLMIAQYTAASIASQNKQLCSPASVDNITSSNGQEDHVSMAANAATKCFRVVKNLERILAIEFMIAMQAIDMRKENLGGPLNDIRKKYREVVSQLGEDRTISPDMKETNLFLQTLDIDFRS